MRRSSPRTPGAAAFVLAAGSTALAAWAVGIDAALPVAERFGVWPAAPTTLALAGGWVAASVIWRRTNHRIAWMLLVSSALAAVSVAAGANAAAAVNAGGAPWWLATAAWASMWTWFASALIVGVVLPQVFPDGAPLPGRGWRILLVVTIGIGAAMVFAAAAAPVAIAFPDIAHPLLGADLDASAWVQVAPILAICFIVGIPLLSLCAAGAMTERMRRAQGAQRVRILLVGVMTVVVAVSGALLPQSWVSVVLVGLYLGSIVFAVTRLGLWELDALLPRLTVGVLLVAALGGVFSAIIAVVSAVTGGAAGTPTVAFVAAFGLAIAFDPLRRALRHAVERAFALGRPDADELRARLTSVAHEAEGGRQAWAAAQALLAEELRTPGLRLVLGDDGDGYGDVDHDVFELVWDDARIGRVALVPRPGANSTRRRDRRIVAAVAPTLALIAHDVTLTSHLERARQEAVERRENDVRRIRRDLHDGLGPLLAGAALSIEAAERAAHAGNTDIVPLLEEARSDLHGAVRDIRVLVHGLRPDALDDLGLEGAMRASPVCDVLPVDFAFDADVEPLPAAVEVALLRIAQEALTNVSRHAGATRATVRVGRDEGGVTLVVDDDGCGLPPAPTPGIGIRSMRERAAELGGTLDIAASEGEGTSVAVWLPCPSRARGAASLSAASARENIGA